MDVFSVSMAVASGPRSPRQSFRLSFHFGLFQGAMPVVGWIVGASIYERVRAFDHWLAFALLIAVAVHMFVEGLKEEEAKSDRDRSKGWSLIALSVATSIDAMAVGLVFGIQGVQGPRILIPVLVIGAASSLMALVGVFLARRMKARFGPKMEIVGALVLAAIGTKMLFTV
ncbi:manganese efflux pump [Candidatus Sumerlaeota bacterium]|nr:manganese efflux pump [Candidatus Sumerlaeota bacterium]